MDCSPVGSEHRKYDTAIYILQLSKEKLNSANLKKLKCLMLYIMKRVRSSVILEAYMDETIDLDYANTSKILSNTYNLVSYEC